MKNFKKIFLALFLLFLIAPFNAKALTDKTNFININDSTSLTLGDLSFSNVVFSTSDIGLTANITNNNEKFGIRYFIVISYYDSNQRYITSSAETNFVGSDEEDINHMFEVEVPNDRSLDDIKYYRLQVDTIDYGSSTDYEFYNYDINIVVSENNSLDITETIDAYFKNSTKEIHKVIPLKNQIYAQDGSITKSRIQISNLSVNNVYSSYKDNGNYIIQIHNNGHIFYGDKTFKIRYTYNNGHDIADNYDQLYYNIINSWAVPINNVTFTITMPKEFDENELEFLAGNEKLGEDNINYTVNGDTITGIYNNHLYDEDFSVNLILPEGYFTNTTSNTTIQDYLLFIIPVALLILSLILWFIYGYDKYILIDTVEFYPPEGFNSLEIGFLYKGEADINDVNSLLIYLADKGYLRISDIGFQNNEFGVEKRFTITKLKDYDGNDTNERIFMDGLFNNSSESIITLSELRSILFPTVRKILSNINDPRNQDKILERNFSFKKLFVGILILITYVVMTVIPLLNYGNSSQIFNVLLFPVIATFILYKTISRDIIPTIKIIIVVVCAIAIGIPFIQNIWPTISQDFIYLIGYLIGTICIIGMFICLKNLSRRTLYGHKILCKINGFKKYLQAVEKDKLESLVAQNPNYFYDILPYTYVLEVSDKWITSFETVNTKQPDWYQSDADFSVKEFGQAMNDTIKTVNDIASSSENNTL